MCYDQRVAAAAREEIKLIKLADLHDDVFFLDRIICDLHGGLQFGQGAQKPVCKGGSDGGDSGRSNQAIQTPRNPLGGICEGSHDLVGLCSVQDPDS